VPKTLSRALISLAVTLGAAIGGLYVSAGLGPEWLRAEVEQALARGTGGPVSMESLRLEIGFPIHLEARNLRLLDGALTIDAASARLHLLSVLTGKPRLARLMLDGAHLRIQRALTEQGPTWSPQPFANLAARAAETPVEPLLAPLHGIEAAVRFLLAKPLLADGVQLRRSRISYVHDFSGRGGGLETLWFTGVHGFLRHSRLRGDAELFLAAQLVARDGPRGSIEWQGSRNADGTMRISMAATELELATLVPYLGGAGPQSNLKGRLSGVADFETSTPGQGQLRLDLITRDFESTALVDGVARTVTAANVSANLQVSVDAQHLVLSRAHIAGPELAFDFEAVVQRPINAASNAGLSISLRDIDIQQARGLIAWLSGSARERAERAADAIRSGRITRIEFSGGAPMHLWREFAAGRSTELPRGLKIRMDVENIALSIGAADRLDDVSARVTWSPDGLEIRSARGSLNGSPLPTLGLKFKGVDRLFESGLAEPVHASGAVSLTGLTPLWSYLTRNGDDTDIGPVPVVRIDFDRLDHPALVWPLASVQTRFEPTKNGAHVTLTRGYWAGVPLSGTVELTFRPDRHIEVNLEADSGPELPPRSASAPDANPRASKAVGSNALPSDKVWASGRFEIGGGAWHQRSTQGEFQAVRGALHLDALRSELDPSGQIHGHVVLDLSRQSEVPYELAVQLERGEISSLLTQARFDGDIASGRLDLDVALRGVIRPDHSALAEASGRVRMDARDGSVRRSVPPVLAVALASESIRGFSSRERLGYRRCSSELRFDRGYVSTDALEIDGPDLRLFASGGLDLARPPYKIKAEVVLFLFRQLDRALEKIPLLNVLLLGRNKNLIAAYFELVGPWEHPEATSKPLRTIGEGPGDVLIEGIPKVVKRGMEALGDWINAPTGRGGAEQPGASAPQRGGS
jgi:AsmA-like C-terminal region